MLDLREECLESRRELARPGAGQQAFSHYPRRRKSRGPHPHVLLYGRDGMLCSFIIVSDFSSVDAMQNTSQSRRHQSVPPVLHRPWPTSSVSHLPSENNACALSAKPLAGAAFTVVRWMPSTGNQARGVWGLEVSYACRSLVVESRKWVEMQLYWYRENCISRWRSLAADSLP